MDEGIHCLFGGQSFQYRFNARRLRQKGLEEVIKGEFIPASSAQFTRFRQFQDSKKGKRCRHNDRKPRTYVEEFGLGGLR